MAARGGWKPWAVMRPLVSETGRRSMSEQGEWKPWGPGVGLVSAMGLVRDIF